MIEDYLYIYNAKGMQFVNIRGIFEDPLDLSTFDCRDGACYDEKSPFPMPADMIQAVTLGMASGELQLLSGTVADTTTDTMQDPKTVSGSGKAQQPSK